jgi:hypothetical protein
VEEAAGETYLEDEDQTKVSLLSPGIDSGPLGSGRDGHQTLASPDQHEPPSLHP